jgi:acetyl esterase
MIIAGGSCPIGSVEEISAGGVPARLYTPSVANASAAPLTVFFHGGGFVVGDLVSYDAVCRFLAERASMKLLSIAYRLAPEHPFPAAHDDALTTFGWARTRSKELGADRRRIGVAGDSAGGNLAAAVALAERGHCAWQFLLYPATTANGDHPSRHRFADDFLLTERIIDAAVAHYEGDGGQRGRRRAEPLHARIPSRVAPATVATAGFDPLRDEGEAYARRLERAGVEVELQRFGGQIHGFLSLIGVSASARESAEEVASAMHRRIHGGSER